jgi:hypothetical protein
MIHLVIGVVMQRRLMKVMKSGSEWPLVTVLICLVLALNCGCGHPLDEATGSVPDGSVDNLGRTTAIDASQADPVLDDDVGCSNPVNRIRGRVVDDDGVAISDAAVVACPKLLDGVKVCIGPIRTDASGEWSIAFDAPHQCQVSLSVRATNTAQDGGSVSCALSTEQGGTLTLGNIKVPTMHNEWILNTDPDVSIGAVTLEATSQNGASLLEASVFAVLEIDEVPLPCQQSGELGRFAVYPDGPAEDVNLRRIHVPNVADGTTVTVSLIGGLFTLIEDEVLGEGQFFELAQGVVMGGNLELDTQLPAFGWLSLRSGE